jgi:hypothetical protein
MKYYNCEYCFNEFVPTRRRVQKYCSNTCRSKAYHERKTSNSQTQVTSNQEVIIKAPNLPPIPNKIKVETMSLAGTGNAVVGNLIADGLKSVLKAPENKPATKGDIDMLTSKIVKRYHRINNLAKRQDGALPYFDMETNEIFYSFLPI